MFLHSICCSWCLACSTPTPTPRCCRWTLTSNATEGACDLACLRAVCRAQAVQAAKGCADDEELRSIKWAVFDLMEGACKTAPGFTAPPELMCPALLAEQQHCQALTIIEGESNGTISDGSPSGSPYAAATTCVWTISAPATPYIYVQFSRLDTEVGYDVVSFEDTDGTVGKFSGNDRADIVSTDTGKEQVAG